MYYGSGSTTVSSVYVAPASAQASAAAQAEGSTAEAEAADSGATAQGEASGTSGAASSNAGSQTQEPIDNDGTPMDSGLPEAASAQVVESQNWLWGLVPAGLVAAVAAVAGWFVVAGRRRSQKEE